MKRFLFCALVCLASVPAVAQDGPALTDAQVPKILIQQSIDDYDGNCPCPYIQASNGSSCGKRSAYSKPGGAEPLCYRRDVSDEMIAEYRRSHSP